MKTYWPVSSIPVSSTPSIRSLTDSLLAHTTDMLGEKIKLPIDVFGPLPATMGYIPGPAKMTTKI